MSYDEPEYERVWRAGDIQVSRHVHGTGTWNSPPPYVAWYGTYATGAQTAKEALCWLASMAALVCYRLTDNGKGGATC